MRTLILLTFSYSRSAGWFRIQGFGLIQNRSRRPRSRQGRRQGRRQDRHGRRVEAEVEAGAEVGLHRQGHGRSHQFPQARKASCQ